ncbi:aminotransferase class I/II-fold pyridoxal phosphate-dependent enzyme [Brenneria tiliae]|uniref:Aminotransferase class I/II-fold pyridoxal phosphate-dependent enzyme n=1 Tax=Brenneria tiliae TaxID=2914984 RepID=A0ABT0MS71_9GAMM|nr:aminotransferase class I/II-fold pyridoxal phosphate-dependent enzyme [Brenneria tiliae]MCL2892108.1 aminotransferase class I/II-fold pyridoxal phosphate-dependent enzyme [Brenneria tiliae]
MEKNITHRDMATRWQRLYRRRQYCRDNTSVSGALPCAQADILICLTLYNEPATMLAETLAGLVNNQLHLIRTFPARAPRIVICILLDGVASAHRSTVELLQSLGLDPHRPGDETAPQNRLTLQARTIPASRILADCRYPAPADNDHDISIMLAAKRHNAGKLDSHAWFFWGVGNHIQAEFAMQIDTASVPEPDCLAQLLRHMWRSPACSAVTTRVVLPPPRGYDAAQNWQYADFLWEKVSDWAIGNALHYLEVVPGQCSLIRWSSFCDNNGRPHAPVETYLRGLEPQGLLEHNLYLAEDRVLGFELVRHHQGSSVRYQPAAIVRSDPSPTFAELVRQRRRWINSTIAARLHSLRELPGVLNQPSISPLRRCGILLSLTWGLLQLAAQFLMPAFIALLLAAGVGGVAGHLPFYAASALSGGGAALLFLTLWSGTLFISSKVGVNSPYGVRCHITIMSLLAGLMGAAWLFTLMESSWQSLLLPGAALLLICIALLLHSLAYLRQIMRWLPLYLFLLPVFSLYLTTYSIANISDISWGTKGLTANPSDEKKRRQWSTARNRVLFGWSVGSFALAILFLLAIPQARWMFAVQLIAAFFFVRIILSAAVSIASSVYQRVGAITDSATYQGAPFPPPSPRQDNDPLPIVRPIFPAFHTLGGTIETCLASGIVTNNGPYVRRLENRLSEYLGVPTLVFCNGEQALISLLLAADVRGKEVILPSFTFAGTAHAVVMAGARPVFADIKSPDSPMLDVGDIERRITADTAAILAVDVYGYASDYLALQQLARRHGLRLFIDSAPAFGTTVNGRRTGGFADGQIFSFHATKPFNTIEGGCVCSHDEAMLRRASAIRNFGQDGDGAAFTLGFNGKMSEINAIIGLAQLPYLAQQLQCRRQAAALLMAGITAIPGLTLCLPSGVQDPVWQYLPIVVDAENYGMSRDELQDAIRQKGIMARRYYSPACHKMPAYRHFAQGALPRTELLADRVLALPIYNDMQPQECERILAALKSLSLIATPRSIAKEANL